MNLMVIYSQVLRQCIFVLLEWNLELDGFQRCFVNCAALTCTQLFFAHTSFMSKLLLIKKIFQNFFKHVLVLG